MLLSVSRSLPQDHWKYQSHRDAGCQAFRPEATIPEQSSCAVFSRFVRWSAASICCWLVSGGPAPKGGGADYPR